MDLRLPVGIAAAAGQQHALILEADVVHQGELVVGDCLFKGPEELVGGGHEQGAVLDRIFLIAAQGRGRVLLGDAVEALDKSLQLGRNGPEIQRRRKYDQIRRPVRSRSVS